MADDLAVMEAGANNAPMTVVDGTWRVSRETLAWFANQARQFRRRSGEPWG